jgi:Xaa-Pro aminopeptidase
MFHSLEAIRDRYNLDGIYFSSSENIRWATGLDCGEGRLIVMRAGAFLFVNERRPACEGRDTGGVEFFDVDGLVCFLEKNGVKRLGYEDGNISRRRYDHEKQDFFTYVELYPVSGAIETARQVKRPEEIHCLTRAQELNHQAYCYTRKNIRKGLTESELAFMIHGFFWNEGIIEQSFEPIVLFGERTLLGHQRHGKRRLGDNEPVLVDFGCKYRGYCSDFARTFFFGNAPSEFLDMEHTVMQAYRSALSCMLSGVQGKEVSRRVRAVLGEYEMPAAWSLAHGVGVRIHEKPFVNSACTAPLKRDMVLAVEPGIYREGRFGIRFEEMVRITDNGAINLIAGNTKLGQPLNV